MRRRIGLVGLVLVALFGGVIGTGGPAGADATHSMAVSPSAGLSDGQVVTVTGTGFTEEVSTGGWAITICRGTFLTEDFNTFNAFQDCDMHQGVVLPVIQPDASGRISTPFTVRQTVAAQSGTIDCRTATEGCAILLGQLTFDARLIGDVVPVKFGTPPPRTLRDCAVQAWTDAAAGKPLRSVLREFIACVVRVAHRHR